VIGREGKHIAKEHAMQHVAGYTLCNEGTLRDWVRHAKFNVTQGKNFDASGSIGPYFVSADEIDPSNPAASRNQGERRGAPGRHHREPDLRLCRSHRLHHDLHHAQNPATSS
jgi:2-keto-4-pentenoate hydratase/2-oxohepta-3-ene-1,7-dioic acid hydratase in catechol pathway